MKPAFKSGRFCVLSATLLLGACAVGPDYVRPQTASPAAYKENADWKVAQPVDDSSKGEWWKIYGDPQLDQLMQQIDISNQTVIAAEASYRQALALVQSARAQLFPTLSADASGTRSGPASANKAQGSSANSYNVALDASWEADLWGRIRRDIEANRASAASSAANLANIRLSAQAQLAQNYFQLRVIDAQRVLFDDTVKAYQKSLDLTQNQYAQGVAAKADVIQAEAQLKSAQSQGIALGVQRAQLEHAIALLIGKAPAEFSLASAPLPLDTLPPVVPAGVPSALLERRPDIAAAERQVAAANAQIGVAQAAFFPTLTLTGSTGFQGSNFPNLLAAPNRFWSFGPDLALTLLDFGARQAAKEQAIAAYDVTVADYRQAVLTAFQEVEDNLAALRILEQQAKVQDDAVKLAEQSVALVTNQYKAGIVNYTNVVTVQATALSNENSALTILNSRMAASVLLIKALGGGWTDNALMSGGH